MSTTSTHLKGNLLDAAQNGDLKSTQEAISHNEEVIDTFGNTPLILAAARGNVQAVNDLLKGKVDVNAQNKYKRNAIFAAAVCGGIEGTVIILNLIDAGCKPDCADVDGNTPLMIAAKKGDYPSVSMLLRATDINVNAQNKHAETALHLAVPSKHNNAIVSLLLKHGANLELKDDKNRTPLHLAVEKENDRCAHILLDAKADLRSLSRLDSTMVSNVTSSNNIIKWIIKSNQNDAEAQYNLGVCFESGYYGIKDIKLALEFYRKAAEQEFPEAQLNLGICYMLGQGVDRDFKMGSELIQRAAAQGNKIAQFNLGLCFELGEGVDKNFKRGEFFQDESGQRNLSVQGSLGYFLEAAQMGDIKSIQEAVSKKKNLDATDTVGNTPLILAAAKGNKQSVIELLKGKLNVHAQNAYKKNAVFAAARHGHSDIISILIAAGCKPDCADVDGNTPLMAAVEYGHYSSVEMLLEKTDINVQNKHGETALHLVDDNKIVSMLLKKGANLELQDDKNRTPLCLAVEKRYGFYIEELLIAKANVRSLSRLDSVMAPTSRNRIISHFIKANQGDAEAQYNLADCFENGYFGIGKDIELALEFYRKAADQEFPDAQFNLGHCYMYGKGVEKDLKTATELFVKAAKFFKKASEQGDPLAQLKLGHCFKHGMGVIQDFKIAAELFKKAADQGNARAQVNLGICFEKGEGVSQDLKKAAVLYQNASDLGYSLAHVKIGNCFKHGIGVTRDVRKAVELFIKAANRGNEEGQTELGICYETGDGIKTDVEMAVSLYTQAAGNNYPRAQRHLGICFEKGLGGETNLKKAISLYRQSAEQQDLDAQKNLLNCLGTICNYLPIPDLIEHFDIFEIIDTYKYAISLGLPKPSNFARYEEDAFDFYQSLSEKLQKNKASRKDSVKDHKEVNERIETVFHLFNIYKEVNGYFVPERDGEHEEVPGHHHMPHPICKLISEYAVQKP